MLDEVSRESKQQATVAVIQSGKNECNNGRFLIAVCILQENGYDERALRRLRSDNFLAEMERGYKLNPTLFAYFLY